VVVTVLITTAAAAAAAAAVAAVAVVVVVIIVVVVVVVVGCHSDSENVKKRTNDTRDLTYPDVISLSEPGEMSLDEPARTPNVLKLHQTQRKPRQLDDACNLENV
jgi:hypothetical protein